MLPYWSRFSHNSFTNGDKDGDCLTPVGCDDQNITLSLGTGWLNICCFVL